MKLGLVCGDGLPVSGLLTVFRNVLEIGAEVTPIEIPVACDLGYSWRPDKAFRFLADSDDRLPGWLSLRESDPRLHARRDEFAERLLGLRAAVASWDDQPESARAHWRAFCAAWVCYFEREFHEWLEAADVDWTICINMTLSDAVPVTSGLYAALARFYRDRPGGVIVWDHDLFGSYAVREGDTRLVYPRTPNEMTPLPPAASNVWWLVVSHALAAEANRYPTTATARFVPNVLPTLEPRPASPAVLQFAETHRLDLDRPVLLNPVRVFPVKGVEIAIRFLAALKREATTRKVPCPYLLVFGDLDEDPNYGRQVRDVCRAVDVEADVRFLNGVPLDTMWSQGRPLLDERRLLELAHLTHGGVVFTPAVTDVESVGLAPALAARARVPCAITQYDAFRSVYGTEFGYTPIGRGDDLSAAAGAFLDVLRGCRAKDPCATAVLDRNARIVDDRFPEAPWHAIWQEMARLVRCTGAAAMASVRCGLAEGAGDAGDGKNISFYQSLA